MVLQKYNILSRIETFLTSLEGGSGSAPAPESEPAAKGGGRNKKRRTSKRRTAKRRTSKRRTAKRRTAKRRTAKRRTEKRRTAKTRYKKRK